MAESTNRTSTFTPPWFAIFVVLKAFGPLAAWSWWWVLLPWVPVLYFFFQKLGWL